eukprot:CAMPEP_0196819022 /NCGR_PEP_ID=MMETSP1362-20130617/68641_1 /TAXON_ID=163516 /ORGANISM="Leptocylindrus danicus, Strain CCMP1856" /LENGTH=969 /DNA_ID=CAMNT_0042197355 /DNA_START=118 /DNA_END=3025 /DNA_ORIENTATION=-
MAGGHHHRAGSQRQSNKRHKSGNASKRSVSRNAGGKIARMNPKKMGCNSSVQTSGSSKLKAATKHKMKLQQKRARQEKISAARRKLPGAILRELTNYNDAPKIIGVVHLSEPTTTCPTPDLLERAVGNSILDAKGSVRRGNTCMLEQFKKARFTVITLAETSHDESEDGRITAALDLARVCHAMIFVVDGTHEEAGGVLSSGNSTVVTSSADETTELVSESGDRILAAVKAQGLPSACYTVLAYYDHQDDEDDTNDDAMEMTSTTNNHKITAKRKLEVRKYTQRLANAEFGDDAKVFDFDVTRALLRSKTNKSKDFNSSTSNHSVNNHSTAQQSLLIRTLCTANYIPSRWTLPRPYIIHDNNNNNSVVYNAETKELQITGYVRGSAPLCIHHLMHVPYVGTFHAVCASKAMEPLPLKRNATRARGGVDVSMQDDEHDDILVKADPDRQESLEVFATPDALEGEQNLIGFDGDADDYYPDEDDYDMQQQGEQPAKKGQLRPSGWSDYQSAWLEDANEEDLRSVMGGVGGGDDDGDVDHGELAQALNAKESTAGTMSVMGDDDDYDMHGPMSAEERRSEIEKRRRDQQEELEFPDEVELHPDVPARDRLARYRSLKSFRDSEWDPKENLPDSYGKVYHFSSFKLTQREVLADVNEQIKEALQQQQQGEHAGSKTKNKKKTKQCDGAMDADMEDATNNDSVDDNDNDDDEDLLEGCVESGSYVTLTLKGVSIESYARLPGQALLCAVALLPHENKAGVMHMNICQTNKCEPGEIPVKSKDVLTFRCGWRTWQGRAVFSQNNLNCDKHKFERFLVPNSFMAASVFGPVTYAPCPVLVFREASADQPRRQLVATGSMIGADADRIVVKRAVLTGYPLRVNKRHATVRYMFFNPEDVKWFKPAGLTTKHGLQGNIVESVGVHGVMKCLFNKPIKQHDTVCLPLFKRVYPKFAPVNVNAGATDGTVAEGHAYSFYS